MPIHSVLTSSDPEPGIGAEVRDALGVRWVHEENANEDYRWHYWLRVEDPGGDPESWAKIAGNYGPVMLLVAEESP